MWQGHSCPGDICKQVVGSEVLFWSQRLRWLIGGAANHFSDEVCLASCDHVSHARNGVKHLVDHLISNSIFLDFGHRNLEDSSNAAV